MTNTNLNLDIEITLSPTKLSRTFLHTLSVLKHYSEYIFLLLRQIVQNIKIKDEKRIFLFLF